MYCSVVDLYKREEFLSSRGDRNRLSARKPHVVLSVPLARNGENFDIITTNSLFNLAEKKIASNEDTLKDFEGPTYLRASEAEENLKA